jgi:hypothetical protein
MAGGAGDCASNCAGITTAGTASAKRMYKAVQVLILHICFNDGQYDEIRVEVYVKAVIVTMG